MFELEDQVNNRTILVYQGNKYVAGFLIITPEIASCYLQLNTKNRFMRQQVVAKYATDAKTKKWFLTTDCIGFDKTGALCNGQHRLEMVVKTGIPQPFLVMWGLDSDVIKAIDRSLKRTVEDTMRILGIKYPKGVVALVRAMIRGPKEKWRIAYSDQEIMSAVNTHIDALCFAKKVAGIESRSAAVQAVFARAYYTIDHVKLQRFGELLSYDKSHNPGEEAAKALLCVLSHIKRTGFGGSTIRTSIYRKTQYALNGFLHGKPLKKIYEEAKDLFPLPA